MPADPRRSVADYRAVAARYDHATRLINGIRRDAVATLKLQPGETVLDVGCGSGFSSAPIRAAIGPAGRLLAFDHSPELLAIARSRVAQAGWRNVTLLESTADAARFDAKASALLFTYVHAVRPAEAALDQRFGQGAPGAGGPVCATRAGAGGGVPGRAVLTRAPERYITNRNENFRRPWAKIEQRLKDFEVNVRWPPGWRYVATGVVH